MVVFVATQKEIMFQLPDIYQPIFVGASLNNNPGYYNYITDNTGENISEKNGTYCELTALYWIWKNSKTDVVGLAHYRRYLSRFPFTNSPTKIATEKDFAYLLEKSDLILPRKTCLWGTVEQQYANGQHQEDYALCGEIIQRMYPEYYNDFVEISKSDTIYICNMFVGKRDTVSKYCEWLFSILFELEKHVDISKYTTSEKRIYGYLSERLFNVWIRHNSIRTSELYLLNTESGWKRRIISGLHTFNYKVLGINVMKHSARRVKRKKSKNK